jgi:hypothetical protein
VTAIGFEAVTHPRPFMSINLPKKEIRVDSEIAMSYEQFVNWPVVTASMCLGFALGLAWLLCAKRDPRRRRSALIDLAWTMTSGIGIVTAVWAFNDLIWQDYQHVHEEHLKAAWDQLASLNGAQLVL